MALQQRSQRFETDRLAVVRLQVVAQSCGHAAIARGRGSRAHAAVADEHQLQQRQQFALQRQRIVALELAGDAPQRLRHLPVIVRIERLEAPRQLLSPQQREQTRFLDVEHAIDQTLALGIAGVRLLRVHQRQRAGRQHVVRAAALVATGTLEDGADGEGIVAVTPEWLAGEVRMEQLHPGQPGARQQTIGVHQTFQSCLPARMAA